MEAGETVEITRGICIAIEQGAVTVEGAARFLARHCSPAARDAAFEKLFAAVELNPRRAAPS